MKKILYAFAVVILMASAASAQRLVLLEHFTQASCPPCASLNPALKALLDQNADKVVAIKYQTSWPGVDPMNAANPTDVQGRVTYYAVNGVPNSVMDGNVYNGSPSGVNQSNINSRHNVPAGVQVSVSYMIISNPQAPSDSMLVTARVKASAALPAGRVLHVAAIEREIEFATAPGSNGEKKFESVMKKMFPSSSGTTLPAMAVGDSLKYSFKMSLKNSNGQPVYYNLGQAAAVAFVQNNTTKEVLGAAYDEPRPWLSLGKPAGQKGVRMKAGESLSFDFTLSSKTDIDQSIKLKASGGTMPAGWSAKIVADGVEYADSASVPLPANTDKNVQFKVTGANGTIANSKLKFKVDANSETVYPGVKNTLEFTAITPSNILFMDLPGTATTRFNQVFTALGEPALLLNAVESADLDSAGINASTVAKMFYSTGASYSGTLGDYRSETFMKYLNSGGRLLVMGQDIGYELAGGSDAASEAFFSEYLGAEYISDGTTATTTLTRSADDTVCAPFFVSTLSLTGTGSYPEQLALSGAAQNAVGFLEYSTGNIGGIYNKGDNWKAVYLGFRMEAFSTSAAGNLLRNTLFNRINGWFDSNPAVTASASGPSSLCQGSNITLTAGPGSTYLWNTGATTQSITVTQGGQYMVQVTEPNGTDVSNIINVTSTPSPVITTQPANQSVANGANATFSVVSSTSGVTYRWQKNDGTAFVDLVDGAPYSGTGTSSLSIAGVGSADNGSVFRCVLSINGCPKNSNAATLSITTSVNGKIEVNKLAYPNPAAKQLFVPVSSQVKMLVISDLSGREVLRQEVMNAGEEQALSLDALDTGVYQLSLEAPGMAPAIQKIVIQ